MPDDAEFAKVNARTFSPNPCSPDVAGDYDFRGIRIAAPKLVRFEPGERDPLFGTFAHIIVCGSYRLDANYLGLRERFLPRVLVVAVDRRQHRAYAARLMDPGSMAPTLDPFEGMTLTDDDFKGRIITEHFNANLSDIMELPEQAADYYVYASLGGYVSNVVRMSVREAP